MYSVYIDIEDKITVSKYLEKRASKDEIVYECCEVHDSVTQFTYDSGEQHEWHYKFLFFKKEIYTHGQIQIQLRGGLNLVNDV